MQQKNSRDSKYMQTIHGPEMQIPNGQTASKWNWKDAPQV